MKAIEISGTVIRGKQLGRKLGFPTANLDVSGLSAPDVPDFSANIATGVYAGYCTLPDGRCFKTMVNIGFRPTVDALLHQLSIEAHLLDFDEDIYGLTISIRLTHFIREERKQPSLDALRQQLSVDLERTKRLVIDD